MLAWHNCAVLSSSAVEHDEMSAGPDFEENEELGDKGEDFDPEDDALDEDDDLDEDDEEHDG